MTTALDLFAGPGGWSVACRALGIDELGVEIEPDAVATARAAGHRRVHADVRRYVPDRRFDGLIASPPCQTFSQAGRGNGRRSLDRLLAAVGLVAQGAAPDDALGEHDYTVAWDADGALFDLPEGLDERSALVLEPMRYVVEHAPTWVALEQVPGVLPVWGAYASSLTLLGYSTAVAVLDAERYGVPQTRRRAILLAHRDRAVEMPPATHSRYYAEDPTRLDEGVLPWVSMAEALGWGMTARPYVSIAAGTAAGGTDPQMLGGSGARASVGRELDAGRWRVNDQSGTARDVDWPMTRPATTVAGRGLIADPGANANRFNSATKSRNDGVRVSVAEGAVLQTFPADYPWQGSRTAQFQQVGDAVPPLLAGAILRELIR